MKWILAVLVTCCSYVAACPDGCSCHHDKGLYVASCSVVPYNAGKVEELNVLPSHHWGSPQELSDGQFNQARHLKYLNLRNNSIYFIHKKAFYGAKGLIEIDLSFNYIEDLDPMLFQHLTSLTTLKLRGNPIQLISEVPFVISNSIQQLDIGQCKLKSVPRGVFFGLKRLRYLYMDGNHLKSLKYNSLPKGIKYLNLSKNLIVNVPIEVLSSLTNLREINLSENSINCSCSLMNLQDWLSGRGVMFEGNVICALPPEYSGISWSKVDENRLCLTEARRDEISHSAVYSRLLKDKLNKKYHEHENSYSEENFQSDQPHPDAQAEVLFHNDETVLMGEMMRDEENKNPSHENEPSELINDDKSKINQEHAVVTDNSKSNSSGEFDLKDSKHLNSLEENHNQEIEENKKEDAILNANKNENQNDQSIKEEAVEKFEVHSNLTKDSFHDIVVKEISENSEHSEHKEDNIGKIIENTSNTNNNTMENIVETVPEDEPEVKSEISDGNPSVNLNGNNTVEYKSLDEEDTNGETDDFKKEGLLIGGEKHRIDTNVTFEDTTDLPVEDTTEDEVSSTEVPLTFDIEGNSDFEEVTPQNSTLAPDTINGTTSENNTHAEVLETIPPPIVIPKLSAANEVENISEPIVQPTKSVSVSTEHTGKPENKLLTVDHNSLSHHPTDQKVKEVAGAEVLMFCVGVLVICLVLFSVYKCRSSNKRQSMGVTKDMESNRGTEMQDMASLLPKPQDDNKKNGLKYPDKGTSSENVKLISEQNENEPPTQKVVEGSKNTLEDKNSLNNNTSSSPTSKTPLLKPGNPVTINPAAPIQRTKVKVGIIPDSIPRTPIFIQKTYNNGTKKV